MTEKSAWIECILYSLMDLFNSGYTEKYRSQDWYFSFLGEKYTKSLRPKSEAFCITLLYNDCEMKKKLLFICTNNVYRSPTAEELFKDSEQYEAKSAGTYPTAAKRVTQELVDWADIIFVMSENEEGHLTFLKNNFTIEGKVVYDLDIPDIYERNNPELIKLLKTKLKPILKN